MMIIIKENMKRVTASERTEGSGLEIPMKDDKDLGLLE